MVKVGAGLQRPAKALSKVRWGGEAVGRGLQFRPRGVQAVERVFVPPSAGSSVKAHRNGGLIPVCAWVPRLPWTIGVPLGGGQVGRCRPGGAAVAALSADRMIQGLPAVRPLQQGGLMIREVLEQSQAFGNGRLVVLMVFDEGAAVEGAAVVFGKVPCAGGASSGGKPWMIAAEEGALPAFGFTVAVDVGALPDVVGSSEWGGGAGVDGAGATGGTGAVGWAAGTGTVGAPSGDCGPSSGDRSRWTMNPRTARSERATAAMAAYLFALEA